VEGCRQVELDPCQREQLGPELAREDRVPVADNGVRHAMEPDNGVEECPSYERRHVGVVECNEVRILGEAVDHREHHLFAMDAWERLDEIQRDICSNRRWYL
jgi:hypothetical protein